MQLSFSEATARTAMSSVQKRIDWDDGVAYTFQDMVSFYRAEYSMKQIEAYWKRCVKVERKVARCRRNQKPWSGGAKWKVKVETSLATRELSEQQVCLITAYFRDQAERTSYLSARCQAPTPSSPSSSNSTLVEGEVAESQEVQEEEKALPFTMMHWLRPRSVVCSLPAAQAIFLEQLEDQEPPARSGVPESASGSQVKNGGGKEATSSRLTSCSSTLSRAFSFDLLRHMGSRFRPILQVLRLGHYYRRPSVKPTAPAQAPRNSSSHRECGGEISSTRQLAPAESTPGVFEAATFLLDELLQVVPAKFQWMDRAMWAEVQIDSHRPLAAGANGCVYPGTWGQDAVVAKLPAKSGKHDFVRELWLLSRLPPFGGSVELMTASHSPGRQLLLLQREGISLRHWLDRREDGPGDCKGAVRLLGFMHQVCLAVSFLHSRPIQIAHGDLKPENFLLKEGVKAPCSATARSSSSFASTGWTICICDYGSAQRFGETWRGGGTMKYRIPMGPSTMTVSAEHDLFALSIILEELNLSGFSARDAKSLAKQLGGFGLSL